MRLLRPGQRRLRKHPVSKKSLLELLVGIALVAAWVLVAAQAERSQRHGSARIAELDNRQLAVAEALQATGAAPRHDPRPNPAK